MTEMIKRPTDYWIPIVLSIIEDYTARNGFAPTMREMERQIQMQHNQHYSHVAVRSVMNRAVAQGLLNKVPNAPRAISLTSKGARIVKQHRKQTQTNPA